MLARQVSPLGARLLLQQDPDDLLFREPLPLHRPSPGPDSGGNLQWHVWTASCWQVLSDVLAVVGCGHVSGLLTR